MFDKQRRYRLAAEYYMMTHRDWDLQPRFDVMEVYAPDGAEGKLRINHIENAFM